MINANHPTPDPAWDYAQLYDLLTESSDELQALIAYVSGKEKADSEADTHIKEKLDAIGQTLNSARRLI